MLELFNIPKQCILNKNIPLERFFDADQHSGAAVASIQWCASLKPVLTGTEAVNENKFRYEEIEVICVELKDKNHLFDVVNGICKKIKYPCLLDIKYGDKFLIDTCQFEAGKLDRNSNVHRYTYCSHWIHPDLLSPGAVQTIDVINKALNMQGNLYEIYTQMVHAVQNFRLGGTTKAHISRLLYDMLGKTSPKKQEEIMKYCTPFKKYAYANNSKASRYNRNARLNMYTYSYDYEDIWYCLLKYEPTKRVVLGRDYRDIQELVSRIDSKLSESYDWW